MGSDTSEHRAPAAEQPVDTELEDRKRREEEERLERKKVRHCTVLYPYFISIIVEVEVAVRAHENAIDALLTRAQRVELIMRRVKPTSSPPAEQTARSPDAPPAPPLAPAGTCALDLSRASPLRALDADIIDKHISETLSNAHNTAQPVAREHSKQYVLYKCSCPILY